MKHFYIDKNEFLGGVVFTNDKQEIVHLSLKAGNEVPTHANKAQADIFIISGEVDFSVGKATDGLDMVDPQVLKLTAGHLLVLDPDTPHSLCAVQDSQIIITKVKV